MTKQILDNIKNGYDSITEATEQIKNIDQNNVTDFEISQLNYFLDKIYLAMEELDRKRIK